MKASQLSEMRHPLCLTAEVPFGKGHAGPAPFLGRGQALPESPCPPFSLGQPISRSREKLCPVETFDSRKGFLVGEGAVALQTSSLHRWDEMWILWRRVEYQPPLGAWRCPSVPSCQTKCFYIIWSLCSHSELRLWVNFGSRPVS